MPQTRLIPALKTTAVQAEPSQPCPGRTVRESITAKTIPLFPTIPLLNSALPHVLSIYRSHFCPVLLSFRRNSLQTKQSRPVWEQVSKIYWNQHRNGPLWISESLLILLLRIMKKCFKTVFEELLLTGENSVKQNSLISRDCVTLPIRLQRKISLLLHGSLRRNLPDSTYLWGKWTVWWRKGLLKFISDNKLLHQWMNYSGPF